MEQAEAPATPVVQLAQQLNERAADPPAAKKRTHGDQVAGALAAFAAIGVDVDEVLKYLCKQKPEDITPMDLKALASWYDHLKNPPEVVDADPA